LISKGVVAADAARRVGRANSWITNLARRYNQDGAQSSHARSPPSQVIAPVLMNVLLMSNSGLRARHRKIVGAKR
jgi:hypothetical protein